MEVLKLENLSKYYTTENSVVVGLSGINLSFSTGEFVALTGESGSGKSTLAQVLGGILSYESGELYVYGKPTSHYDAYDWSKYRRDLISFISQSYGILPGNTVSENVESALRLSGLSVEEAKERTRDILSEVELSEFKNRKAAKLSSGQKQRLSIARALAKPSKILIADEPTGNLDRENSEKVIELLKRASKDRLVILITHEFEEAKDAATRRIVLSDGVVVTDARLSQKPQVEETKEKEKPAKKARKQKPLTPYICRLTIKSRPVFSAILCILLAITSFITFVFLGNFVVALDDSNTRIYDTNAFYNGSPDRLVVMRPDGENLNEQDYNAILSHKYTESIERFSYVNDFIYHYKKYIDHTIKNIVVLGENYDPKGNPDDFTIEGYVEFREKDYSFIRTLPYTNESIITSGRAPEGFYEVVSADPEHSIGDTVRVYIRNKNAWSDTSYLSLDFLVVGTSNFGSGLYFSDKLADGIVNPVYPRTPYAPYFPWNSSYLFIPYLPGCFELSTEVDEDFVLEDDQAIFPSKNNAGRIGVGTEFSLFSNTKEYLTLTCSALHKSSNSNIILVSENTFEKLTHLTSNQASLYIKDYAYAERVIDSLTSEGYITISPYKMGSTTVDNDLANERLITLCICGATLIISFVLQFILLKAIFSSLIEYYKLMSNTGLTAKTAYGAVSLMLLAVTLLGEALGAFSILALNYANIERVVNIFKYLDTTTLIILFAIHFVSVSFSLWGILLSIKKNIFSKGKNSYDIDFTLMEEDAL